MPAGHDAFPFHLVETHLAGCWGSLGEHRDALPGARPLRQRQRAAVQHDGAGAAHRRRGQRRQPAARRGDARDVGRRSGRTWPTSDRAGARHHQRRARADLDVARRSTPPVRRASRRRLARPARRSRGLAADRSTSRTRSCGQARMALRELPVRVHPRARALSAGRTSASAPPRVVAAGTLLDPDALTIGFARRFTGYKRPELIFHDPERLARHPQRSAAARADRLRRQGAPGRRDRQAPPAAASTAARSTRAFGGRIAFVDDYDLHVAHFLVQGCDVWLNNPRKPLEASGTSGMKASLNGVPHLSIGDGWWAEGFTGENGWLIDGRGRRRPRRAGRGRRRGALRRCSSSEIVPTFYDRDADGHPAPLARRRAAGDPDVAPRFSTRRMVKEYVQRMYAPAIRQARRSNDSAAANSRRVGRAAVPAVQL